MHERPEADTTLLLEATRYAAHMHRDQRRKGRDNQPYVNHVIEVAHVLAQEGGVEDVALLCAALLHDTVEDTASTDADIRDRFGDEIADLVAEVTDDKSLPKAERKTLQIAHAAGASERAKMLKLADKICNVRDLTLAPPADWPQDRRLGYLDWAEEVVAGLRGTHDGLEALFDTWVARGRQENG